MRNILAVGEKNVMAGGILRFARLGRMLSCHDATIAFAFDDLSGSWNTDEFSMHLISDAARQSWDATVLMGAGFTPFFLTRLDRFKDPVFGKRVQAVLNDLTLIDKFVGVNKAFEPETVIFNSSIWTEPDMQRMQACRRALVEGAVDCSRFFPRPDMQRSATAFVIGMQSKYVSRLEGIANLVPETFRFLVICRDKASVPSPESALGRLISEGRLEFLGILSEQELPGFYSRCDCILHLEQYAGWANLVAEAMASRVPVVCSRAGTGAIAIDGVTALVVDCDNAAEIAGALMATFIDQVSAKRRIAAALERVSSFSWQRNAAEFMKAVFG